DSCCRSMIAETSMVAGARSLAGFSDIIVTSRLSRGCIGRAFMSAQLRARGAVAIEQRPPIVPADSARSFGGLLERQDRGPRSARVSAQSRGQAARAAARPARRQGDLPGRLPVRELRQFPL